MKKYFLTTALMGTFIAPAFGADKIITSANTCTVDVLGVSDNNATANTIATWDLIDYTLDPGQYLNVTETSVDKTTCPTGSYCVGGGYTVETANNSIAQCPTGYPNSANGASADTQCYTACTVATANIAHATAVTGNDYYGTGTDTCEPTACIAGWHVKPGLNLTDTIGTTDAGTGYISNDNNGNEYDSDGMAASDAGIAGDPMAFATAYGDKGIITGHGRCNTQKGVFDFNFDTSTMTEITIVDSLPDTTGQYCYCQLDGYKNASGEITPITSAPWVFNDDYGSADDCAPNCAYFCAGVLWSDGVGARLFRSAVFNAVGSIGPATCAANTINIDWNPDNGGGIAKTQCTYEGAIDVPADPVKPGYTFMGWKLTDASSNEGIEINECVPISLKAIDENDNSELEGLLYQDTIYYKDSELFEDSDCKSALTNIYDYVFNGGKYNYLYTSPTNNLDGTMCLNDVGQYFADSANCRPSWPTTWYVVFSK